MRCYFITVASVFPTNTNRSEWRALHLAKLLLQWYLYCWRVLLLPRNVPQKVKSIEFEHSTTGYSKLFVLPPVENVHVVSEAFLLNAKQFNKRIKADWGNFVSRENSGALPYLRITVTFLLFFHSILISTMYSQDLLLLQLEQLVCILWERFSFKTLLLLIKLYSDCCIFKSMCTVQNVMWKLQIWVQNTGQMSK